MSPRLNLFTARKAIPIFRQPSVHNASLNVTARLGGLNRRYNSDDAKHPKTATRMGPTEDQLPHVSEEAAAMEKIMGDKKCDGTPASPELEQGTPISEVLQRDEEAKKHMPKVMQEQVKKSPSGTRSFSTSSRRFDQDMQQQQEPPADPSMDMVANMINHVTENAAELQGLKFPAPAALPDSEKFRERYDSVLKLFTNMLMTSGKMARAQRNMTIILDHLRTSSAPQQHPKRRLLLSSPYATLPLNPIQYLNLVVESVAPLIKIKQYKGLAGGGKALPVPMPLGLSQRRRLAIKWIIDASEKRRDSKLANRVAQEIVAVAEGRSSVWEKREQVHKIGTGTRANLAVVEQKRMFMKFGRK